MDSKNIYVYAIEGLDASGKETASKGVLKLLKHNIHDMNIMRHAFPDYNTLTGKRIGELLNKNRTEDENYEFDELFIQNRKEIIDNIRHMDLIYKDTILICDRYYFSSLFYDTEINVDSKKEIINRLTEIEYREVCGAGVITPNITFCLSVNLDTILSRLSRRKHIDLNETEEHQTRFYNRYCKILDVIKDKNNYNNSIIEIIDGNTKPDIIQNTIYKSILNNIVNLQRGGKL